MDDFRLRAFFALHEDDLRYVLEPWLGVRDAKTYNFQACNHTVISRAHKVGLEIPEALITREVSSPFWMPYWRLYIALNERGMI